MKNFLLLLAIELCGFAAQAQIDTVTPPYKRYPTVPPLQLLLSDSSTMFTKNDLPKSRPVLIMLFSPTCEHCQHEAEEIVKHKDDLKNVHIVMATTYPVSDIKAFYEKYNLSSLYNITIGQDYQYILIPFFSMRKFPFLALYNKKKELITAFEGAVPLQEIIKAFK